MGEASGFGSIDPKRRSVHRRIAGHPAMKTEELIRVLEADRLVEPRVSWSLQVALLFGTGLVALIFFLAIGFREDIVSALGTVRFLFKFVVVVRSTVLAVSGSVRSATPVSPPGRWGWVLVVPAIVLVML